MSQPKKMCRYCLTRKANRPRQLCWTCYYKKDVRKSFAKQMPERISCERCGCFRSNASPVCVVCRYRETGNPKWIFIAEKVLKLEAIADAGGRLFE